MRKTILAAVVTGGLATGGLAPVTEAVPRGGSAMWAYDAIMGSSMHAIDGMRGKDRHPSETFMTDLLLLLPAAILLYPLQLIAQAELVLFGRSAR